MSADSKPRRQCAKCPWEVGVDANDIPGGYSRSKHERLSRTIAEPGTLRAGALKAMACHETPAGNELPCVGWLANQLGPGNNIALRLRVLTGTVDANFETVGEQHTHFEATLPARHGRRRVA